MGSAATSSANTWYVRPRQRIARDVVHADASIGGLGIPSLSVIVGSVLQPLLWKILLGRRPALWVVLQRQLRAQGITICRPLQALRLKASGIKDKGQPLLYALRHALEHGIEHVYQPRAGFYQVSLEEVAAEPVRANPCIGDLPLRTQGGGEGGSARNITVVGHLVSPEGGIPTLGFLRAAGVCENGSDCMWRIHTARERVPRSWLDALARCRSSTRQREGVEPDSWPAAPCGDCSIDFWYPLNTITAPNSWLTQKPGRNNSVAVSEPLFIPARCASQAWMVETTPAWARNGWEQKLGGGIDHTQTRKLQSYLQRKGLWSAALFTVNRAWYVRARDDQPKTCRMCNGPLETFDHILFECAQSPRHDWVRQHVGQPDANPRLLKYLWWGLVPQGTKLTPWMKRAAYEAVSAHQQVMARGRPRNFERDYALLNYNGFRSATSSSLIRQTRRGIG